MKFSRRYRISHATSNNSMSKEWISTVLASLSLMRRDLFRVAVRHIPIVPILASPPWRNRNELRIHRAREPPVHLLFRDLYYGNSARTTSRLTFDNNAGASEKAACRGGGAVATGVATRPGEPLSGEAHRWTRNSSAYLSPPRFRRAARDVWPPPAPVPIGETRRS